MCYLSHSLIYHWMMPWISTHTNWCFCRMSVYVVVLQLKYYNQQTRIHVLLKENEGKEKRNEMRCAEMEIFRYLEVTRYSFGSVWERERARVTKYENGQTHAAEPMLCYAIMFCVWFIFLQSHFHRLYLVCPLVCHIFLSKWNIFGSVCVLCILYASTPLKQIWNSLAWNKWKFQWNEDFIFFSVLFSIHIRFKRKKIAVFVFFFLFVDQKWSILHFCEQFYKI